MGKSHDHNQKAWLGILLVALGGYFLLRNFDLIPSFIPSYFFGWEMIMIIIGGSMVATGRKEGFIFLGIGAFFLIPDIFHWMHISFRDWWPAILVVLGVVIFMRRSERLGTKHGEIDHDYFDDMAVFGGSEKSFSSQNFKGGKVTSMFGGSEIDLTKAKLADQEVVVDVFCMFGGNTFKIPNDWTLVNDSFVLFGGFSDSRSAPEGGRDPKKVLRIKGSVLFGGGEVKGG